MKTKNPKEPEYMSLALLSDYKNLAEREIKEWKIFLKDINKRVKNHLVTQAGVADENFLIKARRNALKRARK